VLLLVPLQAGERYDLQVVYRLVALLLSLSSEAAAMAVFASAFRDLPSYKFVPLVYQVGGWVDGWGRW
jgi:ataxia telangiectasia mutated family protein